MCFSLQRRANFPHLNFEKWSWTFSLSTFELQMSFSLQRRAIFTHPTFQKWSDAEVFCAFWLRNVLRATAASNFSCLLWAATSAPAALASLLFDPADTQIIEKTQHFATSLTFRACASSFYWLSRNCIFSAFHLLTMLLCSAFQLSFGS